MAHSGVPGASLLSSNSKYNPLGTVGTILPELGAGASEIIAPGNPFGIATLLARGGFDLSQGKTLGGLLDIGSAGLAGLGGFGGGGTGGGDAAAGASAGTGAAVAAPAAGGFGASLSDFLSNPSIAGVGNIGSAAGADISSGYNSLLDSLGIGGTPAAGAAAPITPVATSALPAASAGDFTALSPASIAELNSANPAGTDAIAAALSGGAPGAAGGAVAPAAATGPLSAITNFTNQHPYLTLGGGLIGSQLLAPKLSGLTGSGLSSQEQALLANEQPAINAANSLISSESSGVLPPGAEASVQQALQANIAEIKARYAATGQSGSSAETQDIANATNQVAANKFSIANQATQTGLTALGLTTNVYNTLVQDQLNRQQQLQNAFSGFFNALGTGTALGAARQAAA